MTKKTRTILFLTALLLFFVLTPSVILYIQGYRFDFQKKIITQTGGIFVKTWPKSTEIYLDGKFKKKTDFLFGETMLSNLLPRKHTVSVRKNGYHEWRKELEVQERLLTVVSNVLLVPRDFEWQIFEKGIGDVWLSPKGNILALQQREETGKSVRLKSVKDKRTLAVFSLDELTGKTANIETIHWSPDEKMFLLETTRATLTSYFLGNVTDTSLTPYTLPGNARAPQFHPTDSNKIFFLLPSSDGNAAVPLYNLWIDDWTKKGESYLLLRDIVAFGVTQQGLLAINPGGEIFISNFSGNTKEPLISESIALTAGAEYRFSDPALDAILISENTALLYFNPKTSQWDKLGDGIYDLVISPDKKMGAWRTSHEIWLLSLDQQKTQPQREAGERILLTRFSERIQQLSWIGAHHLLVKTEDKIKIAEVDDRGGVNIVEIQTPGTPKQVFFNPADKKLYLLSGKTLFVSEQKLTP